MGNWREHAERAEWMKIETFRLSDADRAELFELLRHIVPKRERGHGIETYEGFITPQEPCSATELQAASLVHQLEREQEREARLGDYNCPLAEPVEFAIATVQQHGIKYEGYRGTFLYWHRLQGRWLQIPGNIGAAIVAKRHDMLLSTIDCPKSERVAATRRSVAWDSLYPWRICNSLARLFQIDAFEPNTPLWHALRILDWYENFQNASSLMQSDNGDNPQEGVLMDAAESGLEIGRSYEALKKKPFELHALRGIKTLKAARAGGDGRRGKFEPKTRAVLVEMERLVAQGHTLSRAAELTANREIGTSKVANLALWHRHKPKKL